MRIIHAFQQEAEDVAVQVEGLKEQLGTNKVDRIIEDYPR